MLKIEMKDERGDIPDVKQGRKRGRERGKMSAGTTILSI